MLSLLTLSAIQVFAVAPDKQTIDTAPKLASLTPNTGLYKEAYRPRFHFSAQKGWLNDPNGMVYHDGEYHLYYQAWPKHRNGSGRFWGHAVSKDLNHWKSIDN